MMGVVNWLQRVVARGGGGCFIVTASSGSKNHWMVKIFSKFRDKFMLNNSGVSGLLISTMCFLQLLQL